MATTPRRVALTPEAHATLTGVRTGLLDRRERLYKSIERVDRQLVALGEVLDVKPRAS